MTDLIYQKLRRKSLELQKTKIIPKKLILPTIHRMSWMLVVFLDTTLSQVLLIWRKLNLKEKQKLTIFFYLILMKCWLIIYTILMKRSIHYLLNFLLISTNTSNIHLWRRSMNGTKSIYMTFLIPWVIQTKYYENLETFFW